MVKINVALKTKDRAPRSNYLRMTMENLRRAGVFESLHLGSFTIVDSGSSLSFFGEQIPANAFVVVDCQARTLHQNAARCIETVGEGDAAYGLVLEDDLDVCDQFLEQLAAWLADHDDTRRVQMYVLGANYSQIGRAAEAGFTSWQYPVGAFYGAQALVWKRQDAAQLAEWLGPDPTYNGIRDHGHDLLLQRWGQESGIEFFSAAAPCMVQHIGVESGINNRFFQFPWGGREWRYRVMETSK